MKTLYAKFKASTALDESKPPQAEIKPATSPDICQFGASLRALDERLKNSRPRDEVPADLHQRVMRAIRESARVRTVEENRKRSPWLHPAWRTAPTLALLVVAAVWWFNHRQPPQQPVVAVAPAQPSLVGATELLDVSDQLMQTASAAALSPLASEMEAVKLDFQNMKEFLLASLP